MASFGNPDYPGYDQIPPAARERMAALLVQRAQQQAAQRTQQAQTPVGGLQPQGIEQLRQLDQAGGFNPTNSPFAPGMQVPNSPMPQVPGMDAQMLQRRMQQNPNLMNFDSASQQ
jgi:hypothetical protein